MSATMYTTHTLTAAERDLCDALFFAVCKDHAYDIYYSTPNRTPFMEEIFQQRLNEFSNDPTGGAI